MSAGKNSTAADTSDREILITRLINAPRVLVFEAWTDPRHVDHWMGPTGFATTTKSMDVKPGGVWRFVMSSASYGDFPNKVVYLEVVKPERLVYLHGADTEAMDDAMHVTVTFEDLGDKTHVTMRSVFKTAAHRDQVVREYKAIEGGYQTQERLENYLATLRPRADK